MAKNFPMIFYLKVALSLTIIYLSFIPSFSQGGRSKDGMQYHSPQPGETPPAPDYASIRNWASHPLIHDKGDSIPRPLRKDHSYDSTIDVFFLHPTTYM